MKYQKGTFIIVPNKEALRGMNVHMQAVFLWLCSYADENGVCFPSRKRLAKDIKCSLRTIDWTIHRLQAANLIESIKRKDPNNPGKNLTNLYQIMIPGVDGEVAQDMHEGSEPGALGVGYYVPRELNLLINENHIKGETKVSLPYEVVPDLPVKQKVSKTSNREVLALRDKLYLMFEKEYGYTSTVHMGDYKQVVAALKRLSASQIVELIEDAFSSKRPPHTVREALTARAIDTYLHNQ